MAVGPQSGETIQALNDLAGDISATQAAFREFSSFMSEQTTLTSLNEAANGNKRDTASQSSKQTILTGKDVKTTVQDAARN